MEDKMFNCEEARQHLPLAVAGTLEDTERERLTHHLETCDECQRITKAELILLASAAADDSRMLLTKDVSAETIDNFVRQPESLSPQQKAAVVDYLDRHDGRVGLVEPLKSLPVNIDELLPLRQTPFMASLHEEPAAKAPVTDIRPQWRWQKWLAVAAAVVVVGLTVMQLRSPDHLSTAEVEVVFPATIRSQQQLIYDIPTSPADIAASVYVDPEEGHTYAASVLSTDDIKIPAQPLNEFDNRGMGVLHMALEAGSYRLVLLDIVGNDTLRTEREFTLQLRP